jgi:hypothetical protein
LSTLTVYGLVGGTTYYLRVGGVNAAGSYNYISVGSTTTSVGSGPTNVSVLISSATTLQVGWSALSGSGGFAVDASTANDFTGTLITTVTADGTRTSLWLGTGAQALAIDTTYYIRVGALYPGTTLYSSTISSMTTTDFLRNAQVYQVFTSSIVVNWTPLGLGEGYRLEASSFSDFSTISASSQTGSISLSTLTVQNLMSGVRYYLRVGGVNPNNVAAWVYVGVSGGDTAWVADYTAGQAWPINDLSASPTLGTAVSGMTASGPNGIAITPDGNTAWVTDFNGKKVWPINNLKTTPALGTAIDVPTTGKPQYIAITPDGDTAWVVEQTGGKAWPINNLKTTPVR